MTSFNIQMAAYFDSRFKVERKVLDVVKLLAYASDAVADGLVDELKALSQELREIDSAYMRMADKKATT